MHRDDLFQLAMFIMFIGGLVVGSCLGFLICLTWY